MKQLLFPRIHRNLRELNCKQPKLPIHSNFNRKTTECRTTECVMTCYIYILCYNMFIYLSAHRENIIPTFQALKQYFCLHVSV